MNVETIANQVETGLMPVVQQPDTLTPKLGKETVGNSALHSDWKLPLASLPITEMAPKDDGLTASSQLFVARTPNQLPLGETTTLNKLLGQPDQNQLVGNLELEGDSLARQPKANRGFASARSRSALRAITSTATSPLRLEAEGMTLRTFRQESNAIASGGKLVSLVGGQSGESGSVSGTFNGATGKYNVVLGYYDENDGASSIEARIGGKTVSTVTLNQNLGSSNASQGNLVRRTIASGITLNQGTSLELLGKENGAEHVRIDYVEFIPVQADAVTPPSPAAPPPPAPAPVNSTPSLIRLEAENLSLNTYRVETNAIASGSKLVSLRDGQSGESGSVSGTFNGATGKYNVIVGYYDENDGVSKIEARLDGKTIGTATLNQNLGSSNVSQGNLVRRTIASGITVNKGTSLELLGTENGGEHARIDYVEFVPVSGSVSPTPTPPPPPPAAGDTQAPTARLTASNVTTKGGTSQTFMVTYTDNAAINSTTLDSADVRVTGPNNFSQLASLVSTSSSGTSRTATYRVNAPGGTWDTADNGAYNVAVQPDQVRDTSGNAVASGTLGSFAVNVAATSTPPPAPTPPTGSGQTYFEDNFTNGYSKTWHKESANLSHSIQTTKAPDGSDAVRFEVRRTDPTVALSKRSELALDSVAAGSEQWYGFRVMLPEGWDRDPGSYEVIGQWHEVPDWNLGETWRSPPLAIYVRDGQWRVNSKWDSKPKTEGNTPEGKATLWTGAYETGEWANWVFHVKWSHQSDGILQVWKDGQLIVDRKGPNTYNDQVGPYFKIGVYKPDWQANPQASNTDKRVLYFDQVRIGDNKAGYNAVTPR